MRSYLGLAMIALMGIMSASGAMANKDGWVTAGANTKTRADAVIASAGAADPMVSNAGEASYHVTPVTLDTLHSDIIVNRTWIIISAGVLLIFLITIIIIQLAVLNRKNKSIYTKVKHLNNGNGTGRRR